MTLLFVIASLFVIWAYVNNVFCTTIYLHRAMTHNSIKLHPALALGMRSWLCGFTWQTMIGWVCSHRKHHRYTDRFGDPHSPRLLGLWNLFWTHEKHYRKAATDPDTLANYSWGIPKSRADFILEKGWLGAIIGVAITMALFAIIALITGVGIWWGLLVGFGAYIIQLVAFLKTAAAINSFGHQVGYRNFDVDDDSTNVAVLGLLAAGEGYHNNHHYDQKSPKLSYLRTETDLAWGVIKALTWIGLAKQLSQTINEREKNKLPQI